MKKILMLNYLVLSLIILSSSALTQTKWMADPYHSHIGFSISHMTISEVDGSFDSYIQYM